MSDFPAQIQRLLRDALYEDLGGIGDITSESIFPATQSARALVRSKGQGVVSGMYLVEPLFKMLDPAVQVQLLCADGDTIEPGTELVRLEGPIRALLAGERTMLNLLQRLSGIATQTRHLVNCIGNAPARLLDTRKTTPNLRVFEKAAVVHGKGHNHRFGLFDMVLIKDTHVKAAGGPAQAVRLARQGLGGKKVALEVEVQSIQEFDQALPERPDRIMLDNMTCDQMRLCVERRNAYDSAIELEASGNVSEETIADIAATGVDFISVGSITHSVRSVDIHLVII